MRKLFVLSLLIVFSCTKMDRTVSLQKVAPNAISESKVVGITLNPIEDAYVRGNQFADSNYGKSRNLIVKGTVSKGFKRYAYLKFALNHPANVEKATLRVYGKNTESDTSIEISVFNTSDWNESTLTFNNRPKHPDTALSVTGVTNEEKYYEWDVTEYIKTQSDTASLMLKNTSDQDKLVLFSSREGKNPPQLIIDSRDSIIEKPVPPDHIFVIFEENKGYSQIIDSSGAPFINSLIGNGLLFTNSHGVTHPSYPNYIAWFSGSTQEVNTDNCISGKPFNLPNLYTALKDAKRSFVWYSEDLPFAGSDTCASEGGLYREKHNPTTIFSNVPDSASLPLSAINLTDTASFRLLPNVCAISPNMMNDMHDGTIQQGDEWLKTKFALLIDWCMRNNAVFIITFDEDNKLEGNRIPTIAVGQNVKVGKEESSYDHYDFLKSILTWNGADTTFHANVQNAKTINMFK